LRQVSQFALLRLLSLAHPIMPFVTEEIAQLVPGRRGLLVNGPYPAAEERWQDAEAEETVKLMMEIVSTVRTIRGEMNIKPGVALEVLLRGLSHEKAEVVGGLAYVINRLGKIRSLDLGDSLPPKKSAAASLSFGELHLPLEGIVDFKDEVKRLEKELARIEKDISRYEKKLSRADFIAKAPREVVAKDRRILAESTEKREYVMMHLEKILSWIEE